ncbi:MAG: CDP-alcohol phosphatidyltransferase family protein [Gemmatimonadota bacterium]
MANLITIARVLLVFIVIAVWNRDDVLQSGWLDLAMVPLLAWAIYMDALDGWVARKRHEESKVGALFDIAGDRIVELTLWTFFAVKRDPSGQHFVPIWVAIVIITRTVLTDAVRSIAFGQGKTAFGASSMQTSAWAKQLVSSRWSRGVYGGLKAVTFCALGLLLAWPRVSPNTNFAGSARVAVDILVYLTTIFAIVRAIPVLWEGRGFIFVTSKR